MNKAFRILEIIWLIMGCIGVFMCIYSLSVSDRRGAIYFLIFFIVCGVMYSVRRRQRIKFNKSLAEQQNKAKQ